MDNIIIGYYAFAGLLIGSLFGFIGAGLIGSGIGALIGMAIGWFVAAAMLENQKQKRGNKARDSHG